MKKKLIIILGSLLILLSACGSPKTDKTPGNDNKEKQIEKKEPGENNHSTVLNNMLIGLSKISFNNTDYDNLSDGEFTQSKLWGTFQKGTDRETYLQINAFDNQQAIYGELTGYELSNVNWQPMEYVQYLGVMEEATQLSEDQTAFMYKGRTGDIIFSVTLFGEQPLTEEEKVTLKTLAKEITIEYIGDQVNN